MTVKELRALAKRNGWVFDKTAFDVAMYTETDDSGNPGDLTSGDSMREIAKKITCIRDAK